MPSSDPMHGMVCAMANVMAIPITSVPAVSVLAVSLIAAAIAILGQRSMDGLVLRIAVSA